MTKELGGQFSLDLEMDVHLKMLERFAESSQFWDLQLSETRESESQLHPVHQWCWEEGTMQVRAKVILSCVPCPPPLSCLLLPYVQMCGALYDLQSSFYIYHLLQFFQKSLRIDKAMIIIWYYRPGNWGSERLWLLNGRDWTWIGITWL